MTYEEKKDAAMEAALKIEKAKEEIVVKKDYSADLVSVESAVNAFFDAISGDEKTDRDIYRMYNLFTENASLVPSALIDQGVSVNTRMHPLIFMMQFGEDFKKSALHVKPIVTKIDQFGRIAQALVTAESSIQESLNTVTHREIFSFQLVNYGLGWKITSIIQESESDKNPIPAKYLK
jgi:hypothetical protein